MPWTSTPRSADTHPVVDLSPRPCPPSTTPPTTTCVLWMSPVASHSRADHCVWEKPSRISGSRSGPTQTDGVWDVYFSVQRIKTLDLNEQNV